MSTWTNYNVKSSVDDTVTSWQSRSVTDSQGYRYIVSLDNSSNETRIYKSPNPNDSEGPYILEASNNGANNFDKLDVSINNNCSIGVTIYRHYTNRFD